VRRVILVLLAGTTAVSATAAHAADALKFGPPPAWVHPQAIPAAKPTDAPVALLLQDEQIAFESGKVTVYREAAVKIENAQGLAAGNVALVWQPATDTLTVNKLQIRRGDKIIDVLAGGQSFTTLRRETNLDAATLDGTLTASMQPEGLQEGDIIDLATTTESIDPVVKGHVEAAFGAWGALPTQSAHAALTWPTNLHLNIRQTSNLPAPQKSTAKGMNWLELSGQNVEPLIAPKGAPGRFKIGRLAEASDFASWSDVAALMLPLYRNAAAIPASGPLHDEVEKIRAASADPKIRAAQALALVQDRIRYVALLMGQGGYVPASAEQTWSRRFGDCKAKTVLLLGILHALGIEADPALVQSKLGDMVADRLPMLGLFDHVLVRAHIAGKDYWLDGTRSGDTDLDAIETPDFGWALPLVDHAQLVHLVPKALDLPNIEHRVGIDASAGIYAPAAITIEEIFRGDAAVALNTLYSALTATQRDQQMHDSAEGYFDGFTVSSSSLEFDKTKRQLEITIKGTAKVNWKDGWAYVPTSSIAFDPDFDRPAGPFHDVPWAIDYPRYVVDEATIRLPAGFAAQQKLSPAVHETLAGVEYTRSEIVNGDVLTVRSSERSIAPEVAYKEAIAAAPRIRALDKDDVYLRLVDHYRPTQKDIAAKESETPASVSDYLDRAWMRLEASKFDDAIADLNEAAKADPRNVAAFAGRALAYVWKGDFAAAEKDLDTARSLDPTNPVALRARALLAERKGEFQAAIAAYTTVLQTDPRNGFALGHRAICEHAAAQDEAALADSAQALKDNPAWIDLRVLRANILFLTGKTDAVADEAKLLVEQNPTSDYAFVAAGKIYARIADYGQSMKAFDRALAIKPQAYIYVNRAQTRPFTDKAGRLADLDAALKLDPQNPDALAEKAEEVASNGDYKAALQLYDRVVKAQADSPYYKLRRAVLLFKSGSTSEARALLAEQRQQAKSANDFNNLCWTKATAGILLQEALEDCHEALKRAPDTGGYIDSLALVELRLGKFDDAIADYDRAIAKGSGAASFMGRALAYARKGDKPRADADLTKALKLDSNAQTRFEEFGLTMKQSSPAATKQGRAGTSD
jgi:tetratricopeptide (TPR) repeat protein